MLALNMLWPCACVSLGICHVLREILKSFIIFAEVVIEKLHVLLFFETRCALKPHAAGRDDVYLCNLSCILLCTGMIFISGILVLRSRNKCTCKGDRSRNAAGPILIPTAPRCQAWRPNVGPTTSPTRKSAPHVWILNGSTNHQSRIPTPLNHPWNDRPTPLLIRANGAGQQLSQHPRAAHWLAQVVDTART